MNVDLAQELLNELGTSLEDLETQQAALFQFLKDRGVVTEDQLAPYLNQAGKASNVRWRAARVRLERLISAEKVSEERTGEERTGEERARQEKAAGEKAAEKEPQLSSGGQPPGQSEGKEAKAGEEKEAKAAQEEAGGDASARHDGDGANTAAQGAGDASDAEKSKK
jgi:hypothetical protein